MTTNPVIRARIPQDIKNQAEKILAEYGLNPSSVMRLLFMRIARDKKLPFDPLISTETVKDLDDA